MRHFPFANLTAAVESMPDVFDSHNVIRAMMTTWPHDYVQEQHAFLNTSDPIHISHQQIGRALYKVPGIVPFHRVVSPNVRGKRTINQQWKKVPQPPAAPQADPPATNNVA